MDNRFNPVELVPRGRAWVLREVDGELGGDVMSWDVLGGGAKWPMTNVRDLDQRWRSLALRPENRCLIPVTEFAEWTPEQHDHGDGKKPIKGEMWFSVPERPVFAIAGFWQHLKDDAKGFTMVTCDPNELVAPIHPKAMVTILDPADYDTWLRGSYDDVVALQRPYPADRMAVRGPVVSDEGESVTYDSNGYLARFNWRPIEEYDRVAAPLVLLAGAGGTELGYWGDRPEDDKAGPCWRSGEDGSVWTPIIGFVPERFAEVDEDEATFLAGG